MSILHVSMVLSDPYYQQDAKSALLVAVVLAEGTNDETGVCWPSIERIAKRARTSVRGAQAALRQLQDDGKLEVKINGAECGTNLYRLLAAPGGCNGTQSPPQSSAIPPATERHAVAPKPEGKTLSPPIVPLSLGSYPDENSFVAHFLPRFVNYPDFPADAYLRRRHSDFAAVGWRKGTRKIEDWTALESSLSQQYQQDRNQAAMGGNPNTPRNGHAKPKPKDKFKPV